MSMKLTGYRVAVRAVTRCLRTLERASRNGYAQFAVLSIGALLWCAAGDAQEKVQHRFLLLYSAHSTLAANQEATAGVFEVFDRELGADYEVFSEYRDDQRFAGETADKAFAAELTRKYGNQTFDAVLAFGKNALDQAIEHRQVLKQSMPILFMGIGDKAASSMNLPSNIYGIRSHYSIPGTIGLARKLQPGASGIVVLTGSSAFDRSWQEAAKQQLATIADLPIDYVSNRTLEDFQSFTASLDPHTIVLLLSIFEDAAGRPFTPRNAAELISRTSSAPIYSVYDTFIGRGIVGGDVQRFRDVGRALAEQTLEVVAGHTQVPLYRDVPPVLVVDWRAMERFGLFSKNLPPNTELEFYSATLWEKYWPHIVIGLSIMAAQAATIGGLILQERRRRRAEAELGSRRAELAHLSRVAQMGELSGALAHELNQPLTTILANAEAGSRIARQTPPDMEELIAILSDISAANRRAATIIADLKRLMTKGDTALTTIDLHTTVEDTIRLLSSELLVRRVTVQVHQNRHKLSVKANPGQIKQVLINLLLNAADAMSGQSPGNRTITIETSLSDDGWPQLSISDRGPGLAPSVRDDPFRPFATTKEGGLGLGLSICLSIVKAHGGTIAFDPTATSGARAVVTLPPP